MHSCCVVVRERYTGFRSFSDNNGCKEITLRVVNGKTQDWFDST